MENTIGPAKTLEDCWWIQAVMHFPRDEFLRESWYAVHSVSGRLHGAKQGERFEIGADTLKLLIDAPSFEVLKTETVKAVKGGVIAGDLLASIYLMDRFGLPEPSMRKARHIAQRFNAEASYGDETKMLRSKRSVQNAWRQFESVAHLWAAYRINLAYEYSAPDEIFLENVETFLGVSAAMLKFGSAFVPFRAKPKEPVIKSKDVWRIDESIAPIELHGGEFPDGLEQLLKDYDANEYQ
jgi:hypothetical protein